jgi:hypothetical protein
MSNYNTRSIADQDANLRSSIRSLACSDQAPTTPKGGVFAILEEALSHGESVSNKEVQDLLLEDFGWAVSDKDVATMTQEVVEFYCP